MVSNVFEQEHAEQLLGNMGVGHVRYPTAGSSSCAESQPFYSNTPCGMCLAHNGNLTNPAEIGISLRTKFRHVNTDSDRCEGRRSPCFSPPASPCVSLLSPAPLRPVAAPLPLRDKTRPFQFPFPPH